MVSDDIHRRPAASQAKPTGRKHLPGHSALLGLLMMSDRAVVLEASAVGSPVVGLKERTEMR